MPFPLFLIIPPKSVSIRKIRGLLYISKSVVIHEEVKSHNLQVFKAIFHHSYAMTSRFLPNDRMFYRKRLHDMV